MDKTKKFVNVEFKLNNHTPEVHKGATGYMRGYQAPGEGGQEYRMGWVFPKKNPETMSLYTTCSKGRQCWYINTSWVVHGAYLWSR